MDIRKFLPGGRTAQSIAPSDENAPRKRPKSEGGGVAPSIKFPVVSAAVPVDVRCGVPSKASAASRATRTATLDASAVKDRGDADGDEGSSSESDEEDDDDSDDDLNRGDVGTLSPQQRKFVQSNSFVIPPILQGYSWDQVSVDMGALHPHIKTRGGKRGRRHLHVDPFDRKSCPTGMDYMASYAGWEMCKALFDVKSWVNQNRPALTRKLGRDLPARMTCTWSYILIYLDEAYIQAHQDAVIRGKAFCIVFKLIQDPTATEELLLQETDGAKRVLSGGLRVGHGGGILGTQELLAEGSRFKHLFYAKGSTVSLVMDFGDEDVARSTGTDLLLRLQQLRQSIPRPVINFPKVTLQAWIDQEHQGNWQLVPATTRTEVQSKRGRIGGRERSKRSKEAEALRAGGATGPLTISGGITLPEGYKTLAQSRTASVESTAKYWSTQVHNDLGLDDTELFGMLSRAKMLGPESVRRIKADRRVSVFKEELFKANSAAGKTDASQEVKATWEDQNMTKWEKASGTIMPSGDRSCVAGGAASAAQSRAASTLEGACSNKEYPLVTGTWDGVEVEGRPAKKSVHHKTLRIQKGGRKNRKRYDIRDDRNVAAVESAKSEGVEKLTLKYPEVYYA